MNILKEMNIQDINKRPIWEVLRPIKDLSSKTQELINKNNLGDTLKELKEKIENVSKEITFEPGEHRYFYKNEECIAVSYIVEMFVQETDFDVIAQNYVKRYNLPISWQRQREIWKLKATNSTTNGTFVHQYGEDLTHICNGEVNKAILQEWCLQDGYYIPVHPKASAIYKYFEYSLSNEEIPFLAEIKLILKEHFITGTFDQLIWSIKENGLIMRDYKTNETLTKDFKKPLKSPFHIYNDEALSHYIIQQNLYSLMLKEIGIEIKGMELVWLKDNESFELIKLPRIEESVLKAIEGLY